MEDTTTYLSRIEEFKTLKPGWDSYDADIPNEVAYERARKVVNILVEGEIFFSPTMLQPDVEGGISFVLPNDEDHYVWILCPNDGGILISFSDRKDKYDLQELEDDTSGILPFIHKHLGEDYRGIRTVC